MPEKAGQRGFHRVAHDARATLFALDRDWPWTLRDLGELGHGSA